MLEKDDEAKRQSRSGEIVEETYGVQYRSRTLPTRTPCGLDSRLAEIIVEYAVLAQLVEHLFCSQDVRGSRPLAGTMFLRM